MLSIDYIENHISKATDAEVVACLQLAGFHTFVDYLAFTENTVDLIEKYVGRICQIMPLEQRGKYIRNELFAHNPEKFMFPVPIRIRLISSINEIIQSADMNIQHEKEPEMKNISSDIEMSHQLLKENNSVSPKKGNVLKSDEVKQSVTDSYIDCPELIAAKTEKVTKPTPEPYQLCIENICPPDLLQTISEECKIFYVQISQYASEEFIECYLTPVQDYEISITNNTKRNVKFTCLICDDVKKKNIFAKINFNMDISLQKIMDHLKIHYTLNPDAIEIRKLNNQAKQQSVHPKSKLRAICSKITNHKRPFDHDNPPFPNSLVNKTIIKQPTEDMEPDRKKVLLTLNEIIPRQTVNVCPLRSQPNKIIIIPKKETYYQNILPKIKNEKIVIPEEINNNNISVETANPCLDQNYDITEVTATEDTLGLEFPKSQDDYEDSGNEGELVIDI